LDNMPAPAFHASGCCAARSSAPMALDHVPTEDELTQLPKRWRPYRSLAVSYLFASEYDGGP